MSEGKKYDAGKPMAGLMMTDFAGALNEVAKVATYGCIKYGTPSGWQNVPDAERRYNDAKCRHMLAGSKQDIDEESGLLHLAHEAWNALALLEFAVKRRDETK